MTSTTPIGADDSAAPGALPALTGDEAPPTPAQQPTSVAWLPLAMVLVILLLFIVAAWTLLAAGG
ncbi:MAG: hypothetical protein ABI534_03685 [Chloroflexota bacterium]|jgi:hypothetical protein